MEVVDTVLLIKHLASLLRSSEQIDEFHDTRHQTLEENTTPKNHQEDFQNVCQTLIKSPISTQNTTPEDNITPSLPPIVEKTKSPSKSTISTHNITPSPVSVQKRKSDLKNLPVSQTTQIGPPIFRNETGITPKMKFLKLKSTYGNHSLKDTTPKTKSNVCNYSLKSSRNFHDEPCPDICQDSPRSTKCPLPITPGANTAQNESTNSATLITPGKSSGRKKKNPNNYIEKDVPPTNNIKIKSTIYKIATAKEIEMLSKRSENDCLKVVTSSRKNKIMQEKKMPELENVPKMKI